MSQSSKPSPARGTVSKPPSQHRKERLADALRRNLLRRKSGSGNPAKSQG